MGEVKCAKNAEISIRSCSHELGSIKAGWLRLTYEVDIRLSILKAVKKENERKMKISFLYCVYRCFFLATVDMCCSASHSASNA